MKKISKLRGMQDLDPTETRKIDFIEKSFDEIVNSYGYQEVRFPILENTELFKVIETASRSQQSVFIEMFTGLN